MIYTISKKEGHQTIFDFMANHPEFQFVEERQYFPYEEGETALYYAVLHKDSNVAKTSAPLSEILGNEQQGVYAQTSAAPAK